MTGKTEENVFEAKNTDREIWREREGDYYADSIHVTASGGIGINCSGDVKVRPVREWHSLDALYGNLILKWEESRTSITDYMDICEDLSSKLEASRHRIAELEASLRAALKSHDKIPVNIPLPSWVENARSILEGKQDA